MKISFTDKEVKIRAMLNSISWILEDFMTPIMSIAGLMGNMLCILVLSKKQDKLELKTSFVNLLIYLVSKFHLSTHLSNQIRLRKGAEFFPLYRQLVKTTNLNRHRCPNWN